jgi:tape measure domain-containing protein
MRAATFTTYINAQIDPGLEAAFARQTSIATSSYATITQAANEAARATAGLLSGKSASGASTGTQAYQQRASAIRSTISAAAEGERAATRLASATTREANAVTASARAHRGFAGSLATTATALNVVSGRLDPVSSRISTLSRAVTELTGLQVGLAAFGATIFALGRAGNEYANLSSRIRPFFDSQTDANKAMEDIIGIATRSRTALEPIVEIYARLKSNTDQLGISQNRIGRLTEIASKAATLSGGSTQAREGALVQFSQAIGANFRGSGQEFQSLQEGAPLLLKAIADGYKNVDGSIGTSISNLRKLGQQGALTSLDVADALDRASIKINKQFESLPQTLSTAGVAFGNSIVTLTGRFDQSVGLTRTLADGLIVVAGHLRVIASLAAGIGTAFAAVKLGGLISQAAASVGGILATRDAVIAMDAAWVRDAEITANAYTGHLSGLLAEREAIRLNIVELTRQAEVRAAAAEAAITEQRAIAAATAETVVQSRYSGFASNPTTGVRMTTSEAQLALEAEAAKIYQLEAAAAEEAAVAKNAMAAANQKLSATNIEIAATTKAASTATEELVVAQTSVAGRTGLLRSALGSVVSLLGGPWAIAFAAAATAIYLFVTAESQAEQSARLFAKAQQDLAGAVDFTTGRIIEQNKAKLAGISIGQREALASSNTAYLNARSSVRAIGNDIVKGTRPDAFGITKLSPQQQQAFALIQRYTGNPATGQKADQTLSIGTVVDTVNKLAQSDDRLAGIAARLSSAGGGIVDLARTNQKIRGGIGLLAGEDTPENRQRAAQGYTGGVSGGITATAKPLKQSQILANAKSAAAQTDLEKAKAALKQLQLNRPAGDDDITYQNKLQAALEAVTAAQQAQADARKAASAGRAQERKEVRDAIQDAKDEAAAKRDKDLLALSKQGLNPNSQEFLDQRIKILKTYDDEVNRLDESKAASSSAASQMIADAKRVAAAAASAGEKRRDILAAYDDAPRALDSANDKIDDLSRFVDTAVDGVAFIGKTKDEIEAIKKINPLGTGIYTAEIADADAKRINEGVRKPLRDLERDYQRNEDYARLALQGRDSEAAALQKRNQLFDQGITLSASEYQGLIRNEQQQLRINDALASRQRVVSSITGALDDARSTAESIFTGLQTGGNVGNIFKSAFASFRNQFAQIQSKQLVEKIFAGSDEKLRALLEGRSAVDTAIGNFGTSVDNLTSTASRSETAVDKFATAVENGAARITGALGTGGSLSGGSIGSSALADALGVGPGKISTDTISGLVNKALGLGGTSTDDAGDVVVQGRKPQPAVPLPTSVTPSAKQVYNTIGSSLFKPVASVLDGFVNKITGKKTTRSEDGTILGGSTFFKKIGDSFGTALDGAGKGAIASGFAQALGIKQSQTGAQIGGAAGGLLGQATGIPGLGLIGGLLGGTIGALFSKPKYGSASVSLDQYGQAVGGTGTGNSSAAATAATGSAKSVADGINQIASQLGATISNLPGVTIGTFDGKARVATTSTSKSLNYNNFNSSQLQDFGKDGEADAIAYAVRYSIQNAVISGISAASKKIIASGQDLEQAINKAIVIESIPKRLLQLTDPVKYAVSNLNDEFSKMISYLKEGGATAEQFADAQKLYDLERADAIKQATTQAADQIDQFIKDMVGGSSSPLNKKSTYDNAASDLASFKSDIANGKVVDQDKLLEAARNFQDASRALNGSSSSFFDDFDMLRSLLEKARDNAGITDVSTLPASPFANDSTVQAAISSLQNASADATKAQTDTLSGKLDQVTAAINSLGSTVPASSSGTSSSLSLLPGSKRAMYADQL